MEKSCGAVEKSPSTLKAKKLLLQLVTNKKWYDSSSITMEGKPEYHTQQPGFAPPPAQVVVHHTPLVLGPNPQSITCPSCHAQITTAVELENSTKTHLIALVLCLVCFPCVCVPYCMDSCKSKNHYCPNCRAYLGRYEN
ncbi:hypothetical protein NQ318_012156 [Aromia moschata]|uniref:LITAF domain-containing protein n=1 Tax=Aromia moschata TaxID=1265417 RepID=A0AAV8Z1A4_9CUCU|nr:hypothetical protein NQ318_012156 [Aromia moschata]